MMVQDEKTKGSRSKIANYQKILASNPRSFIFAQLAEEYIKLGELDKAIEICRSGLQYNPEFFDGLYVLGVAFFKKGLKDNAKGIFLRIISKQPEHYLAKEALSRMGISEEESRKLAEQNSGAFELLPEEQEISLEGVVPEESPDVEETKTNGNSGDYQSSRSNRPGSVKSAYRSGVTEKVEDDDDADDREPMPVWLKIVIVVVVFALGAGGFFGYHQYQEKLRQDEIASICLKTNELIDSDDYNSVSKALADLERAVSEYPTNIGLNAQLVQAYAHMLIDFDPDRDDWQRNMERAFASFPAESYNDSELLSAQGLRAYSLGKMGEVRFFIDTARERGLLNDSLKCLEAELNAYDRNFEEAIEKYDNLLDSNPTFLRAIYKKAESQFEQKDFAGTKITLGLLLEKSPEHIRGKLLMLQAESDGGLSAIDLQKRIKSEFGKESDKLPKILLSRLEYLKGRVKFEQKLDVEAQEHLQKSIKLHPFDESLFLLARIQYKLNLFEQAKTNVREAIELNPDDKTYHAFLGRIYFLEDNKTEALRQMEMAIDDSTDDLNLLLMAGDAAYKLQVYEKAVVYYERASFVNFQDINLKKKLILTYIAKRDLRDAKRRIDKLLLDHPDDPVTHFLNGRYLLAEQKTAKAQEAFKRGLEIDPENRDLLFEMVNLYIKSGDVENCYKNLENIVENYPNDIEALEMLAAFTMSASSNQRAYELYSRLNKLRPQLASYKLRLAFLDYLNGEQEKAKQLVDDELAKDPELGYGHILRGVFLFLEGDAKRAEAQIQYGIQIDSKNPEGHFWLGRTKLANNDKTWARNEFELTLECQPVYPMATYEIAVIDLDKQQVNAAKERFTKAMKIFRLFPDTKEYRMKIYLRIGEIEISRNRMRVGLKYIEKASELDPEAAEPYYIIARDSLDKYKNRSKTIGLLQKAIKLNPDFAPPHYELGMVYMSMDRRKEALDHFHKYLSLAPKGKYSSDALTQIESLQ